jgi:hypothetical protein
VGHEIFFGSLVSPACRGCRTRKLKGTDLSILFLPHAGDAAGPDFEKHSRLFPYTRDTAALQVSIFSTCRECQSVNPMTVTHTATSLPHAGMWLSFYELLESQGVAYQYPPLPGEHELRGMIKGAADGLDIDQEYVFQMIVTNYWNLIYTERS